MEMINTLIAKPQTLLIMVTIHIFFIKIYIKNIDLKIIKDDEKNGKSNPDNSNSDEKLGNGYPSHADSSKRKLIH